MKYVAVDIETTGLEKSVNQIIQMAFVAEDTNAPLEEVEKLPSLVITFDLRDVQIVGNIHALTMNNSLLEKIKNWDDSNIILKQEDEVAVVTLIRRFLASNGFTKNGTVPKAVLAGKNISGFDLPFILEKFPSLSSYFSRRTLDPSILYLRNEDEDVPSLWECLSRAGIEKEVAHTALEDAQDIIRVMRASSMKAYVWWYLIFIKKYYTILSNNKKGSLFVKGEIIWEY